MKKLLLILSVIISIVITGCNSTQSDKWTFSKEDLDTLISDCDVVTTNVNDFMDKYEKNLDYSKEVEINEEITETAIENVLAIEKKYKGQLTDEETMMLDELCSLYKYIKHNFEYKEKTYYKSCDISGYQLKLEEE